MTLCSVYLFIYLSIKHRLQSCT